MNNLVCLNCGKFLTKVQISKKGKYCCKSCQISLRNRNQKYKLSDELRRKRSENMYKNPMWRHKVTEEEREKMRQAKYGNTYASKWNSDMDYHMAHLVTKSSPQYRKDAFEHYGAVCEYCGSTYNFFDVHHIDGNRDNNDISNLCVLCRHCHHNVAHKALRESDGNNGKGSWAGQDRPQEFIDFINEKRSKSVSSPTN